jgi:hypothetical protein
MPSIYGSERKASREPRYPLILIGTPLSTLVRTHEVRCDRYATKCGVAVFLVKKYVFDPNNNPRSIKPPEGSALVPVDI